MIQYQILQINITRAKWQLVRRTAIEILGVNGLEGPWRTSNCSVFIQNKGFNFLKFCNKTFS